MVVPHTIRCLITMIQGREGAIERTMKKKRAALILNKHHSFIYLHIHLQETIPRA
jgi:hypothetical protein